MLKSGAIKAEGWFGNKANDDANKLAVGGVIREIERETGLNEAKLNNLHPSTIRKICELHQTIGGFVKFGLIKREIGFDKAFEEVRKHSKISYGEFRKVYGDIEQQVQQENAKKGNANPVDQEALSKSVIDLVKTLADNNKGKKLGTNDFTQVSWSQKDPGAVFSFRRAAVSNYMTPGSLKQFCYNHNYGSAREFLMAYNKADKRTDDLAKPTAGRSAGGLEEDLIKKAKEHNYKPIAHPGVLSSTHRMPLQVQAEAPKAEAPLPVRQKLTPPPLLSQSPNNIESQGLPKILEKLNKLSAKINDNPQMSETNRKILKHEIYGISKAIKAMEETLQGKDVANKDNAQKLIDQAKGSGWQNYEVRRFSRSHRVGANQITDLVLFAFIIKMV